MKQQIITADAGFTQSFKVLPPLYTPFFNRWGKNVYWQTDAFCYDPIHLLADSTPGSPVLLAGDLFIGFLNDVGGTFAFDGVRTLTVSAEKGQQLMICEDCNPYEAWEAYNKKLVVPMQDEPFWTRLEFCTWVEQSKQSSLAGNHNYDILNEAFVYNYLEQIEKMGLPKGKFTIDDGWAQMQAEDGGFTSGNWDINREKFPHFERLIRELRDAGYDPGLWFSPFSATPDTRLLKAHPELMSEYLFTHPKQHYLLIDEDVLHPYYNEFFGRYIDMGIKKLKLDIAYGPKAQMIALLKIMTEEIRKIDTTVEIETHLPDIFAANYASAIRLNDVSIDKEGKWRGVEVAHFEVCRRSAVGRILNLDHIGSNADLPTAKAYMEHWHLLREFLSEVKSYPVISDLPNLYSPAIRETFVGEINALYDKDGYLKA